MKYLKRLLKDKRGVTPVVGVILMVAVTVVMGAVIAGFVYSYVGSTERGPLLGLSVGDYPGDAESILLKHTGGEPIDEGDWKFSVTVDKDSPTKFEFASTAASIGIIDADDADLSAGRTLRIKNETDGTGVIGGPMTLGWYHIVVIHEPSSSLLMDTNVQVR